MLNAKKKKIEAITDDISFSESDRLSKFKQITPQLESILLHI
jgi:hypothetical protein